MRSCLCSTTLALGLYKQRLRVLQSTGTGLICDICCLVCCAVVVRKRQRSVVRAPAPAPNAAPSAFRLLDGESFSKVLHQRL